MALGLGLVGFSVGGCASKVGWSVDEARTCSVDDPPVVCVRASRDYGHTLSLGDAELLPGECAVLDAGRGGQVRVETRDPRGEGDHRWLRAPRSTVTILAVDRAGHVQVVERRRCDRAPFSLD